MAERVQELKDLFNQRIELIANVNQTSKVFTDSGANLSDNTKLLSERIDNVFKAYTKLAQAVTNAMAHESIVIKTYYNEINRLLEENTNLKDQIKLSIITADGIRAQLKPIEAIVPEAIPGGGSRRRRRHKGRRTRR